MKFLHRKRGREAIDEIGIIPRCKGVLIHDGRASYPGCGQCSCQLCGSCLLRELTFVIKANGFRWARLMKRLLREACRRVNKSESKTLAEADRRAVRKRYRTILTQGGRELPEIPPRPKGKRGRIAKSEAHDLHERLVKRGKSVLRFMENPDVSFTDNAGERKIRMAKVKIKHPCSVSRAFREEIQPLFPFSHSFCTFSPQKLLRFRRPRQQSRAAESAGPERSSAVRTRTGRVFTSSAVRAAACSLGPPACA